MPIGGNTLQYDPQSKPTVTSRTVVKAIAVKTDFINSPIASTTIVTEPVIIVNGTYTYNRTAIEPDANDIIVKDGPNITPEVIINSDEYTFSFANNTNAGTNTAQVIISDTDGNYIVNGIGYFTINPMPIGDGGAPFTGITIDVDMVGDDYVVTVMHGSYITMAKRTDVKKVMIIGSGPIIIGQAAEFDYAGTQACLALKEEGYEVVLVNSNPATIMTDTQIADKVYMEPLTLEYVAKILRYERPDAIVPGIGGQTGLNLAMQLERKGILRECGTKLLRPDRRRG